MTDLKDVPFEELKAEFLRRLAERREQKKIEKSTRASCENCAFRIWGKVYMQGFTNHETWVCSKKPRSILNRGAYSGTVLPYMNAYVTCKRYLPEPCDMFLHKDSPEGKKIVESRQTMADRFSDYE